MLAEWLDVKSVLVGRNLSAQYTVVGSNYWIKAIDNTFEIECVIPTDVTLSTDSADFVTNFKPNGNKPQFQQISPFTSKTLANGKSLFKRFMGTSQALVAGSNTFTWTQSSFPWAKFLGLEIINAELGDTCSLYVLDTTTGTFSGVPNALLNQFAFNANLQPGFYKHGSSYDADIFQNLQIKFVYNSINAKTIYLNFDLNEVK